MRPSLVCFVSLLGFISFLVLLALERAAFAFGWAGRRTSVIFTGDFQELAGGHFQFAGQACISWSSVYPACFLIVQQSCLIITDKKNLGR